MSTIDAEPPVLILGCGNSELSRKLEDSGLFPIYSMDISQSVLQKMSKKLGGSYIKMDARDLMFKDESFRCIIDKGTLDALLCSKTFEKDVSMMLVEASRVLQPGGIFIEITFGKPEIRKSYLANVDILHWILEDVININTEVGECYVYVFRKITEYINNYQDLDDDCLFEQTSDSDLD